MKTYYKLLALLILFTAFSTAQALTVTTTTGSIQITTTCISVGGAYGYDVPFSLFVLRVVGNGITKDVGSTAQDRLGYSTVVGKTVPAGTITGLTPGTYTITIYSNPASSNQWTYNQSISVATNAAPVATLTANTNATTVNTPVVLTAVITDADSNLTSTSIEWSIDNSSWNAGNTWSGDMTNTNTLTFPFNPIATGTFYFRSSGTDSQNAKSAYAVQTVTVTTPPPTTTTQSLTGTLTGYPATTTTGTIVSLTGTVNGLDTAGVANFLGTTTAIASQSFLYSRLYYKSPDGIWHQPAYTPVGVPTNGGKNVVNNLTIPVTEPGTYQWYLAGGATTNPNGQLPLNTNLATVTTSGSTNLKATWSDAAMTAVPELFTGSANGQSFSRYNAVYSSTAQPSGYGQVLNFNYLSPTAAQSYATPAGNITVSATDSTGNCTFTLPYACTVAVNSYAIIQGGNWSHDGVIAIDGTTVLDANTSNVTGFLSTLGYTYDDCFPGPGPYSRYAMKSGNGYGSDLTGLTSFSVANLFRHCNMDLAAGTHRVTITKSNGFNPQFLLIYLPVPTSNSTAGVLGKDVVLASGTTIVSDNVVGDINLVSQGYGSFTGVLKKTFNTEVQVSKASVNDFTTYLSGLINASSLSSTVKSDLIAGLSTATAQILAGNASTLTTTYGVFNFTPGVNSYALQITATDSAQNIAFHNCTNADLISLKATPAPSSQLLSINLSNQALTLTNALPNYTPSSASVPSVSTADLQTIASGTLTANFGQIEPPGAPVTPSIFVYAVDSNNKPVTTTATITMPNGTYSGVTGFNIPIGLDSTATVTITLPPGITTTPWTAQGATLTQTNASTATLTNISSAPLGASAPNGAFAVVIVPCVPSQPVTLTIHSGTQTTTQTVQTNALVSNIAADTTTGFVNWVVNSGDATILSASNSTCAVQMGMTNAEVTANFGDTDTLTPAVQYVYAGPNANKTTATLSWNLPHAKVASYPTVRWEGKVTPTPVTTTQTSGTTTFSGLQDDETVTLRYITQPSPPATPPVTPPTAGFWKDTGTSIITSAQSSYSSTYPVPTFGNGYYANTSLLTGAIAGYTDVYVLISTTHTSNGAIGFGGQVNTSTWTWEKWHWVPAAQ